jgi:cytochrome P450
LPDGFKVKKGDLVDYQPYPMGRMKFLWGDDAEEFKPERWHDKDGNFVPQSSFKFTAFQVYINDATTVLFLIFSIAKCIY